jgi:uncharacterized protein (DUF2141 family)
MKAIALYLIFVLLSMVSISPAAEAACEPTKPDALGPFYKPGAPERSKVGEGYVLSGVVRGTDCSPIAGAGVELWLAGPDGRYDDLHRATVISDASGAYSLESNFPPAYMRRPPHIHIRVSAPGFDALVTQHYPVKGTSQGTMDLVLVPNLLAVAVAQSPCPGIHVEILKIRNSTGVVACALFESPDGFPVEYLRYATNIMVTRIRETQARCDFLDIPPGIYALAVIHDENMNGKLDTNRLGIPMEGYGFSNDARAFFGAPSFSAASFQYDEQTLKLTINLRY